MLKKVLCLFISMIIGLTVCIVPGSVISYAAETEDSVGPVIIPESITVSQKQVITGEKVTVSITITDNQKVSEAYIFYESPVTHELMCFTLFTDLRTRKFKTDLTVDNYTECGEWKVVAVAAKDINGNESFASVTDEAEYKADLSGGNFKVKNLLPAGEAPHDYKISLEQTLPLELEAESAIEWYISDESIAKLTDIKYESRPFGSSIKAEGSCTVVPLKTGVVDVYATDGKDNILAAARILIIAKTVEYDVRFDSRGGTLEVDYVKVPLGYALELPSTKKSGYIFRGWSRNPEATKSEFSHYDWFAPDADVTFYAIWEKYGANPTYTVTVDMLDGTDSVAKYDLKYKETFTPPVPEEREGYTFLGWSRDQYALKPDYKSGIAYDFEKDVTIYPVWVETVTTEYYDYVVEYPDICEIKLKSYSTVKWYSTNEEILRPGINHGKKDSDGWYENSVGVSSKDLGVAEVYACDEYGNVVGIYKIQVIESFDILTITFDVKGGVYEIESVQVKKGDSITLPDPRRKGYDFRGWSYSPDAVKADIRSLYDFIPKDDMTLYAKWQKAVPYPTGDVNNDKKINSEDALKVLQHAVGKRLLEPSGELAADTNNDGAINSADALKILQYSVGRITEM